MSSPLDKGLQVRLMFLTDAGAVLGTVEMLSSVSASQQPFRFLQMDYDVERRLREMIQVHVELNRQEQQSIIKDRSW